MIHRRALRRRSRSPRSWRGMNLLETTASNDGVESPTRYDTNVATVRLCRYDCASGHIGLPAEKGTAAQAAVCG
jgi:hypothetical protein